MGFLKKIGKGLGKVAKAGLKVGLKGATGGGIAGGVGGLVAGAAAKKILGGKKKKTQPVRSGGTRSDGASNMERQPRRVNTSPGKGGMSERMKRADKYTTPPRKGKRLDSGIRKAQHYPK